MTISMTLPIVLLLLSFIIQCSAPGGAEKSSTSSSGIIGRPTALAEAPGNITECLAEVQTLKWGVWGLSLFFGLVVYTSALWYVFYGVWRLGYSLRKCCGGYQQLGSVDEKEGPLYIKSFWTLLIVYWVLYWFLAVLYGHSEKGMFESAMSKMVRSFAYALWYLLLGFFCLVYVLCRQGKVLAQRREQSDHPEKEIARIYKRKYFWFAILITLLGFVGLVLKFTVDPEQTIVLFSFKLF